MYLIPILPVEKIWSQKKEKTEKGHFLELLAKAEFVFRKYLLKIQVYLKNRFLGSYREHKDSWSFHIKTVLFVGCKDSLDLQY